MPELEGPPTVPQALGIVGPPFGGAPIDLSLLQSYKDHYVVKAYMLWSGLASLVTARYPTANKGFMNAFVERWHQETSSFHLPVREMTITPDDVSSLLHLPMTSKPIDHIPSVFERDSMKIPLMSLLGISTEEEAMVATTTSAKVRLTWLVELYHRYV
ncbi:uncharacterized protein [Glycine max]|uniref:uncharacterized protein n=1 Tax=Glycine max TaxID=3847 RepID=UPI0003DEC39C|nr:uncharacterized protein LOC102660900 [Glycine max]|eukprot:XP_006577605.1 uncharacterized protein LOC102660900 [Glycine max]